MPTAHSLFLNFEKLLIKEFKDYLEKKGVSKVTSKNYISDVRNFLSRVSLSATHEDVSGRLNKYIVESRQVYSPATLKRKLSSLRIFCDWAVEMGYLEEGPLVQEIGRPVDQPLRHIDPPTFRHPGAPSPLTPQPLKVPMPKELTAPYRVKGDDSLFLHRAKITIAAVGGFGSVFVLFFIVKSIFGDSLIFGPGAMNTQEQKTVEAKVVPEATTVSFGDLLEQTRTVLGASTQKISEQGITTLAAKSREISIYSPNLTTSSRVTVIPENSIAGAIFVAEISGDYFTVAVDRPIPSDILFAWEIVN